MWILDVIIGMNVCDVHNSLTLTICAVMGFGHGIDVLDWSISFSFHIGHTCELSY